MARRLAWWLVVLLAVPVATVSAQSVDTVALRNAIAQAGGRVIIGLKPGRGAALRQGGGGMPAAQLDAIEQRITRQYPLNVRGRAEIASALFATITDADVARVLADSNVELIVPDRLGAPVDGMLSRSNSNTRSAETTPWGVTSVGAPAAWAAGLTGAGIKVGVMDGGIDYTHPDLNVVGGFDAITASTAPSAYNDNIASCNGHGTHVAGTIGAKNNGSGLLGVAPGVSLYALKVFQDFGGSCLAWESDQISALNWAASHGVRVVNISIGNTSYNQIYQNAITSAILAGVTVVASAGNGSGGPIVYPGAYVGVIAVGAVDQANTPAYYQSVGPLMWVTAPGTSIVSTMPGGSTGTKSGTSMAAPHVVGVAALILQSQPSWTPLQVQLAIKLGATDLGAVGFDNLTGWGLVKAPNSGGGTVPVTIAVSPAARSVSVSAGAAAPGDNATVSLSGTNASTTAWTATKKKSWTTLTTASGTGNGTIAWTRNATGLAVGTYVDTLTISAAGITPAVLYDTLKITAAATTVTIALTPTTRSISAQQGAAVASDNATVSVSGTNGWSTNWTATKKKSWTTLTTASGMGNGTIAWTRSTAGLAAGTYVDTLTVSAAGVTPVMLFDTLKITASALTMAFVPAVRSASVQQGGAAPGDNASLTLTGASGASTAWTVTKKKSWTTVTTSSGTGSATISWTRNAAGLAVGTYVDTLTATAAGVTPAVLFDTVKVTAIPVTIALNPTSRSASVPQGGSPPSDIANVVLGGTNGGSTSWTASKKASWNTLTGSSGTGNGSITWTRSAAGLAPGTYVDTLTVSAAGVAPATLIDTLTITVVPVSVAVSPAARAATVVQGGVAPGDNAAVSLSGTNASTTPWTASKKKSWTTLTTASGTGNGTVAWTRNASGLSVGTYVDTLTVVAGGVAQGVIFDTLKITAAPVPVTVAVSPASSFISLVQGNAAAPANAAVTLSGTNASTVSWTATKKKTWNTFTTSSGTGSGTVAWTRATTALAVGTYVDTITVTAAGIAPAVLYDTVRITAVAVVVSVSPASRSVSVQLGGIAPGANATVGLAGTNAWMVTWTVTKKQSWTTLTTAAGSGNGTFAWTRSATGLAAGTYVDTLTVSTSGGSVAKLIDTLKVLSAAVTVSVLPTSSSVTATVGGAATTDSAAVTLTGTAGQTTAWTAGKKKSWTTLTSASGTGNGSMVWTRSTTGLAIGTYVDTLTITAAGIAPAVFYDTLIVASVAVVASVAPAARSVTVQQGTGAPADNAAVTLTGTLASTTAWTASKKKSWTTLTTASGAGSGTVAWTRATAALAIGTYVDTITVAATGVAPAVVYDTIKVVAAPVTVAVSPGSRNVAVPQSSIAPSDNASVAVGGTNGWSTAWTASKKKSWTTLTTASGTGNGTVAWSRNTLGLAVGTYVDTIMVTAAGVAPAMVFDTVRITPTAVTVAASPASRYVSVTQGTAAAATSGTVTLTGAGATSTVWTATSRKTWTTITAASGIGNGTVSWTRASASLPVGTWVDTLTITAAGAPSATILDTVRITAPMFTAAFSPAGRSTSVPFGLAAPLGSATVSLGGTNAWTAQWSVTKKKAWTNLLSAAGSGNGNVVWTRNVLAVALAVGTYVDTLTLSGPGISPAVFYDTLKIVPATAPLTGLATAVTGVHEVVIQAAGLQSATPRDSTTVVSAAPEVVDTSAWYASATSSRVSLVTTEGMLSSHKVAWTRAVEGLQPGRYIDTIIVALVSTPEIRTHIVDTLDVISVVLPEPETAAQELFATGHLNADQRTALDRIGNNNGQYDLGDFLAWVDRAGIHLSASLRKQLLTLPATPVVRPKAPPK